VRWWSGLSTQFPSIGIYAQLAEELLPEFICALALVGKHYTKNKFAAFRLIDRFIGHGRETGGDLPSGSAANDLGLGMGPALIDQL
jgi:hypothetical protein